MLKNFSITIGGFFILLALMTIMSNPVIGKDAFFVTDFSHNFLHLTLGAIFICLTIFDLKHLVQYYKYVGILLVAIAVLGAWSTGSDTGDILGFFAVNGVGHVFNLIVGTVCILIGTSPSRASHHEVEHDVHITVHH
jgi:hypothetical protein